MAGRAIGTKGESEYSANAQRQRRDGERPRRTETRSERSGTGKEREKWISIKRRIAKWSVYTSSPFQQSAGPSFRPVRRARLSAAAHTASVLQLLGKMAARENPPPTPPLDFAILRNPASALVRAKTGEEGNKRSQQRRGGRMKGALKNCTPRGRRRLHCCCPLPKRPNNNNGGGRERDGGSKGKKNAAAK